MELVPAGRASLARGVPAIHRLQDLAVPFAFIGELAADLAEGDLLDRTGMSPARQTGHIQVFDANQGEFIHQSARERMHRSLAYLSHPRIDPPHPRHLLLP